MKQQFAKNSPAIIKEAYRFARYGSQRKKVFREVGIRKAQDRELRRQFDPAGDKLIVFLVPGSDWATGKDLISGGTMSIVSICQETATMKDVHGAQTILCTITGDHLLLKHEKFQNHTTVFRWSQLAPYFGSCREIMIHIPEFMADRFPSTLSRQERQWLKGLDRLHINIMNQNIRYMPGRGDIDVLKALAGRVTITTAHQKYCSAEYRQQFGLPIHKLSVWISPEQYQFRKWADKEDLLVVSPDQHPMKEEVLELLGRLPGLTVRIIQNLTYTEYKDLISRAKWSLTFGEGLDGYFIEPIFSGAIGFAVFNEQFFTPDFGELATVYSSYQQLIGKIGRDIRDMDNEPAFAAYQQQEYALCAKYYSYEQYRSNIQAFYKEKYTLP